MTRVSHCYD